MSKNTHNFIATRQKFVSSALISFNSNQLKNNNLFKNRGHKHVNDKQLNCANYL